MNASLCRAENSPAFLQNLISKNVDRLAHKTLANIIQTICDSKDIDIRQIATYEEYAELKKSRLRMYSERDSYYDKLIEADGGEFHDANSYLFAAYYGGEIVGSIRLTTYPFEVCRYVDNASLALYLERNFENRYLEMSRLVIARKCPVRRLSRALIIYSGLITSLLTNFEKYIAIARPEVKKKSFQFQLESDALQVQIEERSKHPYELIKGSFVSDFYVIMSNNIDILGQLITKGKNNGSAIY
jgi:hypothetical protein